MPRGESQPLLLAPTVLKLPSKGRNNAEKRREEETKGMVFFWHCQDTWSSQEKHYSLLKVMGKVPPDVLPFGRKKTFPAFPQVGGARWVGTGPLE